MLYNLLILLDNGPWLLSLLYHVTFRAAGAMLTALLFIFIFGSPLIYWLRCKQDTGQPIRPDGPRRHLLEKRGIPTMGGVMILFSITVSVLLWADLSNIFLWVTLFVTLGYGAIGFVDDYLKIMKRDSGGLSAKFKLLGQIVIGSIATGFIVWLTQDQGIIATGLVLPFFEHVILDLSFSYYIFAVLVIVGTSNAVNLTDGLDGLVIVPVLIASSVFMLIAYLTSYSVFANYLQIHYIPGTRELVVFCGALIGSGLGFLWFNAYPAMVFMGDTGSLAMGGALGTISVITKNELVLAIVGGLFVLEAVSVIIQVVSFKLTGKRVFYMAPLHHHFERKGWQESTIVVRFWIIATILAVFGLSTLKLR